MKKNILFILFLLLPGFIVNTFGQNTSIGRYRDYFGSSLDIYSNGTFSYRFSFDMISKWTMGTWSGTDTIVLVSNPIYDMVPSANPVNGVYYDSLVLSIDTVSSLINREDLLHRLTYGQDPWSDPKRFLFKKNRLYALTTDGKRVMKKHRGFWTRQKFPSYYFKM